MIQHLSSHNIDDLIHGIESIIKNRCSLLDEDRQLLSEVIIILKKCKRIRGKTTVTTMLLIIKAVELAEPVCSFVIAKRTKNWNAFAALCLSNIRTLYYRKFIEVARNTLINLFGMCTYRLPN